jgi:hypothetical protein
MTPREAEHVRTLAAGLDKVCLVRWETRMALDALLEASWCPVEGSQPWEIAEHEPGDVTVELAIGPVLLDPAGGIVR